MVGADAAGDVDLQLVLEPEEGADREAYVRLVREVTAMLRRELAVPVRVRSMDRLEQDRDREKQTRGDAVAVATMVLAIPAAAVSLLELAARTRVKDVLRRALARARQGTSSVEWRTVVDQMALRGDDERSVGELVDKLASAADSARD